jgi:hypothetical protein
LKGVEIVATVQQRMLDGTHTPTEREIMDFIEDSGATEAWTGLRKFMQDKYDTIPEMIFDKKQGWDLRYRKSGKTLTTLTPEKGSVRVLIVLGREEAAKALSMRKELSPKMYKLIEDTKQLHDGRWLWIRLHVARDAEDVKKLLQLKRKPKKT